MRNALSVLATACVLSEAATVAAQPVPAGHDAVQASSSSDAVIVTGALLLGASYLPSYAAWLTDSIQQIQCLDTHNGWSLFSCQHVTERSLWIPLAGPWMTLSSGQIPGGQWTGEQRTLLVADGIAQDVGFAVLAYGVLRKLASAQRTPHAEAPAAVVVRPGAGTAMAGLTVAASF